jgi:hypothetical protein
MASFIQVMPRLYPKSVFPSIKPLGDDVSSRRNVSCEKEKKDDMNLTLWPIACTLTKIRYV